MSSVRENQQLGAFRVLRRIGSGGMGDVWLAHDTRLLRSVAIKILPDQIAADDEARARLVREARLAAQLNHPSITTIHSIEEDSGCLFVAMEEFVEGKPLGAAVRDGELSDYDVVRIGRDIADALAEAHERGIVHRDIKPDNVMVWGRRVKVLDFGIAKQIETHHGGEFRTEAGMIVGTVEYMSPEQALGKAVDARTDLFSLGVLLYEALSGVPPFKAGTPTELLVRICSQEPKAFDKLRPDLPQELAKTIARCMQKEREQRFASARELAAALEQVMQRLSRTALPATPTMVVAGPVQADAKVHAAAVVQPQPSPSAEKRILIADDDPAIRRLFESLARRQGFDCDCAANGPEAIAALKEGQYTLMFLDLMMPRIDGWGVLDYLRTRASTRVPVLFVITAFLDQTVSPADREIVTGVIYKPVDADEIASVMRDSAQGGNPAASLRKTRHRLVAAMG